MPRTARLIVPNCPHHIVQRGHNRKAVFVEERDYKYYLRSLAKWKDRLSVRVHAYCLMTNHVHLVLDPGADVTAIARLMKRLGGRQTRYVNMKEIFAIALSAMIAGRDVNIWVNGCTTVGSHTFPLVTKIRLLPN